MTRNQILKHKWKIGEKVWLLTYRVIRGFHFNAYGIVEATVESLSCTEFSNKKELRSIGISFPNLKKGERIPTQSFSEHYQYCTISITNTEIDFVFLSKKTAEKALESRIKKDEALNRLANNINWYEAELAQHINDVKELKEILENGL